MPEFQLQPQANGSEANTEEEIRLRLTRLLQSEGQHNLEKNIRELLAEDGGFIERFTFFLPHLNEEAKSALLISGCSAGSEIIVARRFGFQTVVGTEITPELVKICRLRVQHIEECHIELIQNARLPFADEQFSMVYSGHVIEHTPDPLAYFREHLRVLKRGGYFFLEFPHRYHSKELHTGQRSFEWAPLRIRNAILRMLASPISPIDPQKKQLFDLIRRTLRPVSLWQIRWYLRCHGFSSSKVVAVQRPAPGFLRVLLRK